MVLTENSARGVLVGALTGDVLGAPYETRHRVAIEANMAFRGGLVAFDYLEPFKWKRYVTAGQPTDDSELTAGGAESLASTPEFDPVDMYHRKRGFIHGHNGEPRRSLLTNGKAYGSGGTLRASLRAPTYADSFIVFREGRVPVIPSNGSLMCCSSVPVRYYGDLDKIVDIARRHSCITHVHPSAQAACMAYSVMLNHLLAGLSPVDAWFATRWKMGDLLEFEKKTPDGPLRPGFEAVLSIEPSEPREEEIWPNTGSVILSLRIALWAVLTSGNFRDGLTKAIMVGGDTDTYGAIAGGLLGARYGLGGIPQEWQSVLIGRERMLELADELLFLNRSETK